MGFSSSEATFLHVLGSKESPKDGLLQHIFPTSRLRVRPHLMVGRSSGSWSGEAEYHLHTHRCGDMCERASRCVQGLGQGAHVTRWRQAELMSG